MKQFRVRVKCSRVSDHIFTYETPADDKEQAKREILAQADKECRVGGKHHATSLKEVSK